MRCNVLSGGALMSMDGGHWCFHQGVTRDFPGRHCHNNWDTACVARHARMELATEDTHLSVKIGISRWRCDGSRGVFCPKSEKNGTEARIRVRIACRRIAEAYVFVDEHALVDEAQVVADQATFARIQEQTPLQRCILQDHPRQSAGRRHVVFGDKTDFLHGAAEHRHVTIADTRHPLLDRLFDIVHCHTITPSDCCVNTTANGMPVLRLEVCEKPQTCASHTTANQIMTRLPSSTTRAVGNLKKLAALDALRNRNSNRRSRKIAMPRISFAGRMVSRLRK